MAERVVATAKAPEAKQTCSNSSKQKPDFYSSGPTADMILQLQRTAGNRAVQRLIKSGALQPKLRIGQPNDVYEQEADRVAEQVMRMPELKVSNGIGVPKKMVDNHVQRNCPGCKLKKEEEEKNLQSKEISGSTPEITPELESSINAVRGGGQPLPESTRAFFEPRFGQDFSGVRVHNNLQAAESARDVNALAFTTGNNIVFGSGQYVPETDSGRRLMAHELTHVVQQRSNASVQRHMVQRDLAGFRKTAKQIPSEVIPTPKIVPYAAAIVTSRYPHLAKVLSSGQMNQIQKNLDAQFAIEKLASQKKMVERKVRITSGGYGGESTDVAKWELISNRENELVRIRDSNKDLYVDSKLLLADDVRSAGALESSTLVAYHEELYKRIAKYPIRIEIEPQQVNKPDTLNRFLTYYWGPGNWIFGNDGGLITFNHLMQAQKLSLEYLEVNIGEQVRILGEMVKLRLEIGDTMIATGKKLGTIRRWSWDRNIKVGTEIGDHNGYYNDSKGQWRMIKDLYKEDFKNKSRVVLLSTTNWLHLFETDPRISSVELTSPDDDGYVYLLDEGKASDLIVQQFITGDSRHLEPGRTKSGSGWRTKEELTDLQQFAIGAILGDAFEETTTTSLFGQIIIGLIPVVGQIADARDVAVGIHKIWTTGGKDGKLQTGLALVGFVPFFGDFIKSITKPWKKGASEAVGTAVKKFAPEVEETVGNELSAAAKKGGREEAAKSLKSTPEVKDSFVKAVKEHADKSAGKIPSGIRATRESTEDISKALGRQLPSLKAPRLLAESLVKLGKEEHAVRVVQIGDWMQIWMCSDPCGSIIKRIGEILENIDTKGPTKSLYKRLEKLRDRILKLEDNINSKLIPKERIRPELNQIAAHLNDLSLKHPEITELIAFRFVRVIVNEIKQFAELAEFRRSLGLPPARPYGTDVVAKLEGNGKSIFGKNGGALMSDKKFIVELAKSLGIRQPLWQFLRHAEGDVLIQAFNKGIKGENIKLFVDMNLCQFCKSSIKNMIKVIGIKEITIITPEWPLGRIFTSS